MTTSDPVRIVDSDNNPIHVTIVEDLDPPPGAQDQFDSITGALIMIDTVHHEVHEGEMFSCEHSASVLNSASLDFHFKTGTKHSHTAPVINAGGSIQIYLYEAPTLNTNGTSIPVRNMKRSSSNVAGATAFHTPSVGGVGSTALINGRLLPGGTSPTTRIGGSARNTEWILKPSTSYLLRCTNVSGGTIVINPVIEFYEEDEN